MLDISEKLKTLRKKNKLTIQTVADGIGIAVRTYQNYEYGQREISVETLDRLADFYGVTTDYLLGRDGAAPPPDPVDTVARELKMQEMERLVMDEYFKLPEHLRHEVTEFLERLVERWLARIEQEKAARSAPKPIDIPADFDPYAKSAADMTEEEMEMSIEAYRRELLEERKAAARSSASQEPEESEKKKRGA